MAQLLAPKKLPDETHEVIVVMEGIHVPTPEFDTSPKTHEVLVYDNTTPADDIAGRLACASVIVVTICPINGRTLGDAPYLKCIISQPTGTDHIDLDECRRRNIQVMNCPSVNIEAVSEHALALYFAARRNLVRVHNALMDFDEGRPNQYKVRGSLNSMLRDADGRAPPTCTQETVAIMGYGPLGKRVATLCRALGMEVIISERKDGSAPTTAPTPTQPRVPFPEAVRGATVIMICLPLTPATRDLIGAPELAAMRRDAVVVSVSRGGIVNEAAVADALAARRIAGYAADVHAVEPAGSAADSVLLGRGQRAAGRVDAPNLTLTPHLAWFADTTLLNVQRTEVENLRAFLDGKAVNVIVPRV